MIRLGTLILFIISVSLIDKNSNIFQPREKSRFYHVIILRITNENHMFFLVFS